MSCELRTQVKIFAIVGLVLTAFTSIGVFQSLSGAIQGKKEIWEPLLAIPVYVFSIAAYTPCLKGARSNEKIFLIPMMIFLGIHILYSIILAAILSVSGYNKTILDWMGYDEEMSKVLDLDEAEIVNILIFASLASIGLCVYILATLVRFYLKLSSSENQPSQPARVSFPMAGMA